MSKAKCEQLATPKTAKEVRAVLVFSIPDKVLRPNNRSRNYWYINAARRKAKMEGIAAIREQYATSPFDHSRKINVRYTYHPPAPRGQWLDDDNAIGAMKYYRDGVAEGLQINDKHFITWPLVNGNKEGQGKVVAEFWQSNIDKQDCAI